MRLSPSRKNRIHAKIYAPRAGGVSRYGRFRTNPFHRHAAVFRVCGNRVSARAGILLSRRAGCRLSARAGGVRVPIGGGLRRLIGYYRFGETRGHVVVYVRICRAEGRGRRRQWIDCGGVRGPAGAGGGAAGGFRRSATALAGRLLKRIQGTLADQESKVENCGRPILAAPLSHEIPRAAGAEETDQKTVRACAATGGASPARRNGRDGLLAPGRCAAQQEDSIVGRSNDLMRLGNA